MVVAIILSQICFFVRLYLLKRETGYEASKHIKAVYINVLTVAAAAVIIPFALAGRIPGGFTGFLISAAAAVVSAGLSVLYIGCTKDERQDIYGYLRKLIRK